MQGIESRLAIAYAVAQQWFGGLMRPRTPADAWLVEGLAGYLHDLFLRRFLGKNELRYRYSHGFVIFPQVFFRTGIILELFFRCGAVFLLSVHFLVYVDHGA